MAGRPGQIPAQLVGHTLFYFTQEGDLVFDPMAGGTDTCLAFSRRCWYFDLADRLKTAIISNICFKIIMSCDYLALTSNTLRRDIAKGLERMGANRFIPTPCVNFSLYYSIDSQIIVAVIIFLKR